MVEIIRKGTLPDPSEVAAALRQCAATALRMTLREARPAGSPLLFSSDSELIEPAIGFLHEHAMQRAYTDETLRTYSEILYDWFDSLEQSDVRDFLSPGPLGMGVTIGNPRSLASLSCGSSRTYRDH